MIKGCKWHWRRGRGEKQRETALKKGEIIDVTCFPLCLSAADSAIKATDKDGLIMVQDILQKLRPRHLLKARHWPTANCPWANKANGANRANARHIATVGVPVQRNIKP